MRSCQSVVFFNLIKLKYCRHILYFFNQNPTWTNVPTSRCPCVKSSDIVNNYTAILFLGFDTLNRFAWYAEFLARVSVWVVEAKWRFKRILKFSNVNNLIRNWNLRICLYCVDRAFYQRLFCFWHRSIKIMMSSEKNYFLSVHFI